MAVSIGNDCVTSLDDEGQVWMYGNNLKNMTGNGGSCYIPVKVEIPVQIIDVSCAFHFAAAVDITGQVYSWGKNYGQFKNECETVTCPTIVPNLENIRAISCGQKYAICIDFDNYAFSFGFNRSGETGINSFRQNIPPKQIMEASDIKEVDCGHFHTIFLTHSGKVFGCGSNTFHQIGMSNLSSNLYHDLLFPPNISRIACGAFHTILLSEDNVIITYGSNTQGKSGVIGDSNVTKGYPKFPEDVIITQISGGLNHTALIDSLGDLWIFGKVSDRRLYSPYKESVNTPVKSTFQFPSGIATLSKHGDGIIVKTNDESVYAFSTNNHIIGNIEEYSNSIGFSRLNRSRQKSARK